MDANPTTRPVQLDSSSHCWCRPPGCVDAPDRDHEPNGPCPCEHLQTLCHCLRQQVGQSDKPEVASNNDENHGESCPVNLPQIVINDASSIEDDNADDGHEVDNIEPTHSDINKYTENSSNAQHKQLFFVHRENASTTTNTSERVRDQCGKKTMTSDVVSDDYETAAEESAPSDAGHSGCEPNDDLRSESTCSLDHGSTNSTVILCVEESNVSVNLRTTMTPDKLTSLPLCSSTPKGRMNEEDRPETPLATKNHPHEQMANTAERGLQWTRENTPDLAAIDDGIANYSAEWLTIQCIPEHHLTPDCTPNRVVDDEDGYSLTSVDAVMSCDPCTSTNPEHLQSTVHESLSQMHHPTCSDDRHFTENIRISRNQKRITLPNKQHIGKVRRARTPRSRRYRVVHKIGSRYRYKKYRLKRYRLFTKWWLAKKNSYLTQRSIIITRSLSQRVMRSRNVYTKDSSLLWAGLNFTTEESYKQNSTV